MSCLYSSPEVTSVELLAVKSIALKLQTLDCRHRRLVRSGTRLTRDLIAVQFDSTQILFLSTQILPYRRRQQRRAPHQPSGRRWLHQVISACQNKHRFLPWLFKRNIRLSFALRSKQRSYLKPSRSIRTCVLEPFTRGGLSL